MNYDALISKYPKLYHMAEKENWDNILKNGLLSTTALLDLFEYRGIKRFQIESQLRGKKIRIDHPDHGYAIIRDQDPMCDKPPKGIFLEKCLDGINPQQWFEFLNRKVFFWADRTGLSFMLGAKLYRFRSHLVITVDTEQIIKRYETKITLSSINSGSLYNLDKRNKDTFKPLSNFKNMRRITELAVDYSIPDIFCLTISVHECISQRNNVTNTPMCKIIKRIWSPS
jgi:hypothetical protein